MLEVKDELIRGYEDMGYETEFKPAFNMLVIRKDGQHAAFNALDSENGVAMWRHIGDQGTVYFPSSWLDEIPLSFYGTKTYVSGARFEFAFRSNASRLNPEWKMREKDISAIEYYKGKLDEEGFKTDEILSNFWSYNPFWIERGYDPFSEPVLVFPIKQD